MNQFKNKKTSLAVLDFVGLHNASLDIPSEDPSQFEISWDVHNSPLYLQEYCLHILSMGCHIDGHTSKLWET
jgi:hypothetical protein